MPIPFHNDEHRAAYEKIDGYLRASSLLFDRLLEAPLFRVQRGNAVALINVMTIGALPVVVVISPLVRGAPADDLGLLRYLLGQNAKRRIGGFAMSDGIDFKHMLHAASCTAQSLYGAIADVLAGAEAQDEIVARWGGHRWADEDAAPGS